MKLKSRGRKIGQAGNCHEQGVITHGCCHRPREASGMSQTMGRGQCQAGSSAQDGPVGMHKPSHTHTHRCSMGQGHIFTPGGRRRALVHSLSCLVLPIPLQELPALCASPANSTH